MTDEGSCAGSVCGSGSRETVLDGGGEEGEMVCGTTVTAEVEMTGGGEAATTSERKEGEVRLGGGSVVTSAAAGVGGTTAGGIMIRGMGLFDNSGACNGGLIPSVSTASPMDLLTVRGNAFVFFGYCHQAKQYTLYLVFACSVFQLHFLLLKHKQMGMQIHPLSELKGSRQLQCGINYLHQR